jgi:hypothetical protein
MGRFMSPDPYNITALQDTKDPQRWNGYAYARNNPLRFRDPTGLAFCSWEDGTHDDRPEDGGASKGDCSDQGGQWNYEAGDEQPIRNDSGDTATIKTPGQAVSVYSDSNQADYVFYYGQQVVEEDLYTKRLKAIAQLLGKFPTVCGPVGVFGYAGGKGAYGLVEYDSQSGLSSGGLFEAGKGVSGGYAPTATNSGVHQEGLVFVGEEVGGFMTAEKNPQIGPFVGADIPGTNLAAGVGAYGTLTSVAGCPQ